MPAAPALYRRYRPRTFAEIKGQDHVTRALRNAVRDGRVGHAYLFSGPRGTGKTSAARVLAKALNCEKPADGEPCCVCENCLSVENGVIVDWMQELDAASNNKVDQMRELLERVPLGTSGTRKVYVLDEVHMLTAGASNALLKTLEEPPAHVVFVLATTDPQKVLPTIRSRTQHFEFHLLPSDVLGEHVRWVIDDAKLELGDDAVEHVLRLGAGSARDALSALDQVSALGGVIDESVPIEAALDAIAEQSAGAALVAVADAISAGHDPRVFGTTLISRLRDAFLAVMGAPNAHLPAAEQARAEALGRRMGPAALTRALDVLGEALVEIRNAADVRIVVEVALVRLTRPDADRSLDAVLERLERLERSAANRQPLDPAPVPAVERGVPAERSPDAPTPGGGAAKGARPADDARAELERSRGRPARVEPTDAPEPKTGARPTLGGVRKSGGARRATPPESPRDAADGGGVTTLEPHAVALADASADAPAGAPPSRDELTLAWGDGVLSALPLKVRSKWRSGRFVEGTESAARFAVPNEFQRGVCEPGLREVSAALSTHFGRAITIEVVVDDAPPADEPTDAAARPLAAEPAAAVADEAVDPAELVDAGDAGSGVDKLLAMFPGAELREEEP